MTNAFYSSPVDLSALTKALSADINTIDSAVDTAFDKLPTETHLKRGTIQFAVDTGTANAYLVALPYTPSGYVDGLTIKFRPINTNTTAATVNVSSLGVKSLRRDDGTACLAGDIVVGIPITATYSTTTGYFHITGNSASTVAATAASAAAALVSENNASSSASAASGSASTASTQASNAASSASSASSSASTATTQAGIATDKAVLTAADRVQTGLDAIATAADVVTAGNSASTATTQASNASTSASTASTQAGIATTKASEAAASAASAAAIAGAFVGTSATSWTPAIGAQTFVTQTGEQYTPGATLTVVSAATPSAWGAGQVTSYSGTSLLMDITVIGTSITAHSDWNISLAGVQGPAGPMFAGTLAQLNAAVTDADVASTTQLYTGGLQTCWIPAGAMVARTTNGAASGTVEMATTFNMFKTLDFDTAASEYAQFTIQMPKSWNEDTVTAAFVWSHAATTTNFGTAFGLQGVAISNDDTGAVAFGTSALAVDTGGTTNDIYISPTTAAITIAGTPAANDYVMFQVYRAVADAGDTMAIDARLHGVQLFYATNAATDA